MSHPNCSFLDFSLFHINLQKVYKFLPKKTWQIDWNCIESVDQERIGILTILSLPIQLSWISCNYLGLFKYLSSMFYSFTYLFQQFSICISFFDAIVYIMSVHHFKCKFNINFQVFISTFLYRNTLEFYILILYPEIFLNILINSNSYMQIWGDFLCR